MTCTRRRRSVTVSPSLSAAGWWPKERAWTCATPLLAGVRSTTSTWRTSSWRSPEEAWRMTRRRGRSMSEVRTLGPTGRFTVRQQLSLGWAFVDRQKNLWKRHWAWEVVWLVYGVVNTLAITFIAKQLAAEGIVNGRQANDLILFLLIGTLVWAYLSAILDDI